MVSDAPPRAWRNLARITRVGVYDHDPPSALVAGLASEGDPLPIRRPPRVIVKGPVLRGVGDLADVASVRIHREERSLGLIGIEVAAKDDLPVCDIRTAARTLLLVLLASSASSTAGAKRQDDKRHQQSQP